jgi:hypothetical protein
MSPWSRLPNAAHIDRVISLMKKHPGVWSEAWVAAGYATENAVREMTWEVTFHRAHDMDRVDVWTAAKETAYNATYNAARDALLAWYAARDALLALVVYDNSAKYLDTTSDKLSVWAMLSEEPESVLLLPAVIAFERISKLDLV